MKGTISSLKKFEIFNVGNQFVFHLFTNMEPKEKEGTVEYEGDIYFTNPISFASPEAAAEYVKTNYQLIIDACEKEEQRSINDIAIKDAHRFLDTTDYRTLKAVGELPEVKAILEERYPGFINSQQKAREAINKVF
ncbi:hypothetical protein [uncultured Sphaerochaeta sp.]|uniref:hypothetical protein n=1 Tax=uncultured Sphaerochaeta sp. TaxID=886478 RepID=UPI002A0A7AA8|nr:hypothetical protein [uncultured Sphaerochaeta sp.]